MSGNLFVLPKQAPLSAGAVVPGAKLTFSLSGTSTPQNTYQDIDLQTPHDNPVEADAEGVFPPIYFDPSFSPYRVTLTDSDDVQIYQVDGIPASGSGQSLELEAAAPYIQFRESDASSNNKVWRLYVNSEQFKVQLGNDAEDTFADIAVIDRTANSADSIALTADSVDVTGSLTQNTSSLDVTSGSFTPTFVGFSADPSSPTVRWVKQGRTVFVFLDFTTGTSNATTFSISNVPAAIQADYAQMALIGLQDNGVDSYGTVSAAGSSFRFAFENAAVGGFTASGSKGLSNDGVTFSYFLGTTS